MWKMKGVVLVVFSFIAISQSDAQFRKKPNIDVFEIRENQLTKKLHVQPVKLQYDLESEEIEPQASKLSQLLQSYKKKNTDDVYRDILKKIRAQKGLQVSENKPRQPVVLVVPPEYLDGLESHYHSDQDDLMSSFLDETRTQGLKPESETVFNIVPSKRARKARRRPRIPVMLRSGDGIEDRSNAPPSRYGDRPYDDNSNDRY